MSITTLPTAQIPTTSDEILLMDRVRNGEVIEGVNMQRLQMLIDHQARGGALTLTYKVTVIDDELKNKRIERHLENKRKL